MYLYFLAVDACDNVNVLKVYYYIKELLKISFFLIPFVLILMVTIDFAKNVISKDEETMKANTSFGLKRILYAVVIFLIPFFAKFAVKNFVETDVGYGKCLDVTLAVIKEQSKKNEEECIANGNKWDDIGKECLLKSYVSDNDISINGNFKLIRNGNGDSGITGGSGVWTYYKQGDSRWGSHGNCIGKKMRNTGCGLASFAVVANGISGKSVTPEDVRQYLCSAGGHSGALEFEWLNGKTNKSKSFLNYFNVTSEHLFSNGDRKKTYVESQGEKMLELIHSGSGIVLLIPNHYVAIGPGKNCTDSQVYMYDVARPRYNGCYTPKALFDTVLNYEGRCVSMKNVVLDKLG